MKFSPPISAMMLTNWDMKAEAEASTLDDVSSLYETYMEKETSCINAIAILDYLERHNVDCSCIIGDLDPEIDSLEDPERFLRDSDNWVSCTVISKLYERATSILHDEEAAYKMGRCVIENASLGYAQRIIVKAFWSYKTALKHCQKLNDQWNRSKKVELHELKENEATVRLHWDPRMGTTKHVCQYNQGIYTYIPVIWGGPPLTLKERCCYFDGAPYCEYHLKWSFKNRLHEILSRFFTSRSVLKDIIKEMEKDKRTIEEKTEKLSNINKELQKEITERKEIEGALRESEERYRSLVENQTDLVCRFTSDGTFVFVNNAYCQFFKKTKEELIGKKWNLLWADGDVPFVQEKLLTFSPSNPTTLMENSVLSGKGDVHWMQFLNTGLFDHNGKLSEIQSVGRDITARKQAEKEKIRLLSQLQQAQKMESIGTLAGGIAHDFNNILGIILGNAELAMDDVPEWNPARQNLDEVRKSCMRAKDVVRQILRFSRKSEAERKPLNIAPVVSESLGLLRASIPTSIEIRRNLANDLPDILGDPTQIHQIMMNLCTNAAHAMEDKGGTLGSNHGKCRDR